MNWWKNVYGLSCIYNNKIASIELLGNKSIVSDSAMIKEINLYTVEINDTTSFVSKFDLTIKNRNHYVNTFNSIIDANQEQPATRKLHKFQMKCKCCNIARDNSNSFHKGFNPNSEKVSKLVILLNKEKIIHICQS